MNIDLLNLENRKTVLKDIRSFENQQRKAESLADYEIYNNRLKPYVETELIQQLGESSALQMPKVSTLNVGKYVVDNEATIYNSDPERQIENASDADISAVNKLYEENQFNSKLQKANKWFKYREQSMIQVVPNGSNLNLRVLYSHNLDIIPDETDPTKAFAVIVSNFDKSQYLKSKQDNINQVIADADDYKKSLERFVVWTAEYNFVMDGNGNIVSDLIENTIKQLPFVDVAKDKDYEYFIRNGQTLSDFTIQYNVGWSDVLYINRMQGFSIGVLKGDPNLKPTSMTIAPAKLLFLPTNPNNPDSKIDLDFKNPNPNLDASLKVIKELLTNFLFMRGVDSKKISSTLSGGSASYSSAIERLLAMIEEFEATKEDFDLFRMVEKQVFDIVKKYLVVMSSANVIDSKYRVSNNFINAEYSVTFKTPEMIETKSESLDNSKKKIELGIADATSVLMETENLDEKSAFELVKSIAKRKREMMSQLSMPAEMETESETESNDEDETDETE